MTRAELNQMRLDIRKECGLEKPIEVEVEERATKSRKGMKRSQTNRRLGRPGEILFFDWAVKEGRRLGVSPSTIRTRFYLGKYKLNLRRVNKRVVFVKL